MSKQDRQPARTATQLELKYDWGKTFAQVFGLIDDAQTAADDALKAVGGLDEKLDHEEIFNRLTNYGKVQGIYRSENDDIYINASYIKSGTLSADRIDATNLKVTAANITGLLTANQFKMGGRMSVYETVDSNNLAGYFGYVETSLSMGGIQKFSGKGVGLDSSGHIIMTTTQGNLALVSVGDVFLASSGYVNTYGTALRYNDVNIAYSSSDLRLKKNIDYNVSDKLISVFDELKPATFEMGKDFVEGQNHIGFIAQDVVEAVTNAGLGNALIATDCNGMYALNYNEIGAVLTAKIKQLEARLNELEGVS